MSSTGSLVVTDDIAGRGEHEVAGGFLLAPEWTATAAGNGWLIDQGTHHLR